MPKSKFILGVATAALLVATPLAMGPMPFLGAPAATAQDVSISFNIFFDRLRPHGLWVRHARHRYVWCPEVDVDWRPYTRGRWVYMRDVGWYFASDEPFAWAVYHYGRWIDDDRLGWCWVPGRNWAPAWVSWRRSDREIGWAPLPPEGEGFQISVSVSERDLPEDDWFFVPVTEFLEPDLSIHVSIFERDRDRHRRHFEETQFVGPVVIQNNVVINNIIDIDFIQQQTNQDVQVVEPQPVEDPEAAATVEAEGAIPIFAPEIEEPTEEVAPEDAVEPEEAAAELPQAQAKEEEPAEGEEAAPAEGEEEATPAEGEEEVAPAEGEEEAAPAEGEEEAAPAEDEQAAPGEDEQQAAPADCPEGQELVEGECVTPDEQQPAEEESAPADEQQAPAEDEAAPAEDEAAPAEDEAAPAEDEAAPAEEEAAPTDEQPAPAEEAAPAEEQAPPPAEEEAAPPPAEEEAVPEEEAAPEEAAPAEERARPLECPEGQQPVDGRCLPIEAEGGGGGGEEIPAE